MFDCECVDDGVVVTGAHLSVQDGQFCSRRLENNAGLLQAYVTGSGAYQIFFTNEPSPSLATFAVAAGSEFGNIVAINADGKMRQVDFPNTPNLVLQTNAAGQIVASALGAATIPDPLTVTTLNATTVNAGALNATGVVKFTGLGTGTVVNTVGLDGSGNLIKGSNASGVQCSMFYESPTSPSNLKPNEAPTAGQNLVIGNQLYDSGGSIVGVVDGQTLKILVAGKYRVDWGGHITYNGFRLGAALNLTVNGTVVNSGNAASFGTGSDAAQRWAHCAGFHFQDFAVDDIIRIQLANGSGAFVTPNTGVYALRAGFTKFA